MKRKFCFDIESSSLLDDSTVDYTASPWKLKDSFKIHCIVAVCLDDGEVVKFVQQECYTLFPTWAKENVGIIIGHNIINFDLLALKAALGMDYTVGPDTWQGEPMEIIDTLVMSKTLNPDRKAHSLDYFGEQVGLAKIDWRAKAVELGLIDYHASKGAEFLRYHPEMLVYNERDVVVNIKAYELLLRECGDWPWQEAYELEKAVAEIITRQSHRGFWFDVDLAVANVKELDILMEERRSLVEPCLPAKPMGKTKLKDYIPCKNQFLKNGEPSANIIKWCEKHGGFVESAEYAEKDGNKYVGYQTTLYGKLYILPIPQEPIVQTEPSNIEDTTFIKGFLVEMGWQPTQYKERDLTVDTRKQKITQEKFKETVERYVEQTLNSPFCKDRCERVGASRNGLRDKLLKHDLKKPLKVYTNPTFTVGQEKEMDPALEMLGDRFPHVKSIVEYLTYRHRRNSILGGGVDPDDWEEEDDSTSKGFLANVRADGRIPTPADTCGAATGRFKHRVCVNVARVSSLYGEPMRRMFGIGDKSRYAQFAFDFASLENRVQSHYCYRYDSDKAYCNSLILEKPLDSHTQTAKKVSEVIGQEFSRQSAKSVGYACLPMDTLVLTKGGWKKFENISIGDAVLSFNATTGLVEDDTVQAKHYFEDKELFSYSNKYDEIVCTEDHRWYGWKRGWAKRGEKRGKKWGFFKMSETTQDHNILSAAKYLWNMESVSINSDEARFLGWVCSDGYYAWSKKKSVTSSSHGKKKEVRLSISQSVNKYWKDIEDLLDRLGADYTKSEKFVANGNTVFNYDIKSTWARPFLDRVLPGRLDKHNVNWTAWLLSLSEEAANSFYEAFYLGDGNMLGRSRGEIITQNRGNILDAIIACKLLRGSKVTVKNKSKDNDKCVNVRSQTKAHITCQELSKKSLGIAPTFCLTTKNSSFIIKQSTGYVGITGNCVYGAQAARVAKTVGCDIVLGQKIFDAFWEASAPLLMLKERLTQYWKTTGQKKFILGLDNRKINTRSEHALLNSLFQSAGIICAKRTMVFQEKLLKERGLSVDFWKDDWKNKQYAQQIIHAHDEAQFEVTKGLIKWKKFDDKEACSDFIKNNTEWLGPVKSERGYFAGHSVVSDIAKEAVELSNKHYKLNVPMAVDPQFGTNWAECH